MKICYNLIRDFFIILDDKSLSIYIVPFN